jgi:putative flippase GtrA
MQSKHNERMKLKDMPALVHMLFAGKTPSREVEMFRYFVTSCASFVFDFGLLYLLTDVIGLYYLISAVISYGSGMVVSYLLSIRWAFARRSVANKSLEFGAFVGIGIAGMGINTLILWLWASVLGLNYLIGRFVSAVIGFIWKFVARKIALFR